MELYKSTIPHNINRSNSIRHLAPSKWPSKYVLQIVQRLQKDTEFKGLVFVVLALMPLTQGQAKSAANRRSRRPYWTKAI